AGGQIGNAGAAGGEAGSRGEQSPSRYRQEADKDLAQGRRASHRRIHRRNRPLLLGEAWVAMPPAQPLIAQKEAPLWEPSLRVATGFVGGTAHDGAGLWIVGSCGPGWRV